MSGGMQSRTGQAGGESPVLHEGGEAEEEGWGHEPVRAPWGVQFLTAGGARPPSSLCCFLYERDRRRQAETNGSVYESPVRRKADAPQFSPTQQNRPTNRPKDGLIEPFQFPLIYDIVIESKKHQPASKAAIKEDVNDSAG